LTNGATVEQVAAILGNSPAVVINHYSQWIKSRQDALDDAKPSNILATYQYWYASVST
jgi:hypothetical protein